MKQIIYVFILVFCVLFIMASSGFDLPEQGIKFIQPEGWPKPVYDFSKNKITNEGFTLGRKLFFDPMLSRDSTISCATCHRQSGSFANDGQSLSKGIGGLKGARNAPGLFNLAWNTSFMWDGGVNNLEVQPLSPITNPVEMDNTLGGVVYRLNQSRQYKRLFYRAFGDSLVTGQHILKALAQFTVMLQSYNSKYDKFVRKEHGVKFNKHELKGLALFRTHCAGCHKEPLFTDNSFRNNGLAEDTVLKDIGRMRVTGQLRDSLKFRVPTLRNVCVTAPYMHDGRYNTLRQVLDHYSSGLIHMTTLDDQLKSGIPLTEDEKISLLAFLDTLTDAAFLNDIRFMSPAE